MNPTKIHVKRLDTDCSLIPKAPRTLRQRTYILGRYTLVCVEGDAHHGAHGPTLEVEFSPRRSRRRPSHPTPHLNSSEERARGATWTAQHGRPHPRPAALANTWRANHICCSHASCKHRAHYIQCQLGKRRRRTITMAVATAAAAATTAEEAHSLRGSAAEPGAAGSHAKMRRRRHCGGDARTRASRRQGDDHREYPRGRAYDRPRHPARCRLGHGLLHASTSGRAASVCGALRPAGPLL